MKVLDKAKNDFDNIEYFKFDVTKIGRAHVRTPVTEKSRMPSSA